MPNAQEDVERPNVITKQTLHEDVSRLTIPSSDEEDCDVDVVADNSTDNQIEIS